MKTDGLLFFTHFGRDSLTELTGRLNHEGIECEAPTLIDMHDLGDMLADNGFYDPVTDTAKLELSYKKAGTFWQDMETLGLWNALKRTVIGSPTGSPLRMAWASTRSVSRYSLTSAARVMV